MASQGGDLSEAGVGAFGGADEGVVVKPVPDVCQATNEGGAGGAGSRPISVELKANSDKPEDFTQGELQVANESYAVVELSSLELRYYFQSEYQPEDTEALKVVIDHAQVSGRVYRTITSSVHGTVVSIEDGVPGADSAVSLVFQSSAGTLLPGETALVQFRVHPPEDWYYRVARDQANDYSHGACPDHVAAWPKVVLLADGEVASGVPPVFPSTPGEGGAGGGASTGEGGHANGEGGAPAGGASAAPSAPPDLGEADGVGGYGHDS